MFPRARHRMQRGFAIVSAIFLLVALAALGGFIAVVSTTQNIGSAQDFQGTQVYYAARAGAEWGLYQALKPSSPSCAPESNFMVDNIAVTVTCDRTSPNEAGAGDLYTIDSTACTPRSATATFCPGGVSSANYIERRVSALADSTPR